MKAILEFNLDNQDEKDAHLRAVKADKAYRVLYEMSLIFREVLKYEELTDEVRAKVEELSDKFYEEMTDNNINLGEEYR